jgi:hypothetical protein
MNDITRFYMNSHMHACNEPQQYEEMAYIIKLSVKSGKDGTETPLFGHIGVEISKNRKNKLHWASTGHETQFCSKFWC